MRRGRRRPRAQRPRVRRGQRRLGDLGGVDASDVYQLRSYFLANVRLFETAYLQVEQGLLDADARATLGWTNFLESEFLARMWPHARSMVSPAFVAFLEEQQPRLGQARRRGP